MHFIHVLPDDVIQLRSWTIYDLIDDWIINYSISPGRQIIFFLLSICGIAGIMVWVTMQMTEFPSLSIGFYVFIQIVSLAVTITIHELCHASVILYYGGRPRFGAKWMRGLGPVVYATTRGYFTVYAYRRIAAAPLVIISVLCIVGLFLGIGWWVIVPFIFNSIGAGGDLLSLRALKRYPLDYLIEDTEDGFTAYGNTLSEIVSLNDN